MDFQSIVWLTFDCKYSLAVGNAVEGSELGLQSNVLATWPPNNPNFILNVYPSK